MRLAYIGNHQTDVVAEGRTPWSTESAIGASLELLGHEVVRIEEREVSWPDRIRIAEGCDMLWWTSTWDFATQWPVAEALRSIAYLNDRMPTVAAHLDRWWNLSREDQVMDRRRGNAMFRCRWVWTADGDSDHLWPRADVNHRFMPPAVYGPECVDGTARDEYRSDVAFVGSWQWYTHAEHWPYRKAMLDRLSDRYGSRFRCWPEEGEPAVRARALNDLYASVKIVAGDSCLAHMPETNLYWSDRATETIGRGSFMVHPAVPGLMDAIPEGMGVAYYPKGDWDAMCERIDWWLAHDDEREEARRKGQQYIREHHTWEVRLQHMLDVMKQEGAFR